MANIENETILKQYYLNRLFEEIKAEFRAFRDIVFYEINPIVSFYEITSYIKEVKDFELSLEYIYNDVKNYMHLYNLDQVIEAYLDAKYKIEKKVKAEMEAIKHL